MRLSARIVKICRQLLPLGVILLFGLILRLWGIGFGLPYKYHIDEAPYVVAALKIASGDLNIIYPYNSPNVFQVLLTIEYGLLFVGGLLTGLFNSPADIARLYEVDPSLFFLLARGTSAVLGSLTVVLIFLLGKRLENRLVGLLAALIYAFSFAPARDAHYATTDTLITTLIVAALLMTTAYAQSGSRLYLGMSSFLGGAAVGLKYLPAPVLVPLAIVILWRWNNQQPRSIYRLLLLIITSGVMAAIGFLVAFPALVIDPDLFLTHWFQVWNQASSPLGSFVVDTSPGWIFYGKVLIWGMGWPVCLAALAGLVLSVKRWLRNGWWIVLLFTILYYVTINIVQTHFARYTLPLMPVAALLAAVSLAQLYGFVSQRINSARMVRVLASAFLLVLCIGPLTSLIRHNILLGRTDTRTLAKIWIETHIPEESKIGVQWYGPPLASKQESEPESNKVYNLAVLSPFDAQEANYALATYTNDGVSYLIVNDWNQQFIRKNPQENLLRQRFYGELRADATLIKTFSPTDDPSTSPAFFWEQIYGPATELWQIQRPGPVISIYSLERPVLSEKK